MLLALRLLLLVQTGLPPFSGARAASDDDEERGPRPGNIEARGSFTCDFTIPGDTPLDVAPVIERDRMYMAARPGFQRKQIPLRFDNATGASSAAAATSSTRGSGESHANAPADCGTLCGNGVCDAGEDTQNCPGDCRLP